MQGHQIAAGLILDGFSYQNVCGMKIFLSFLVLVFLFACGNRRDENQYDTNAAEVVDNPGDLKRGDAETNEQAAADSPAKTRHPSGNKAHPTDKELHGEKSAIANSFATKAAEASEGEVALSEMAAQKTKSQKIIAFAKMMMKDHGTANKELKGLANQKGIELPEECLSCEANYKILHDLNTEEFDQQYAKQMVQDHEKAVALFTTASQNERDPDLKKWASEKLPVLKHHLAMAKELAQEQGVSAKKQDVTPSPKKEKAPHKKNAAGKKRDRKTVRS
jgi:putative membrane protein